MTKSQELTARMVPALEATKAPTVGDISLVPALRTRLTVGEENLNTVGLIDTGSEFSMIDDALFKTLSSRPKNGVRVSLHTGISRKQLWMYHVDVTLLGDSERQHLSFESVPVVVANLDRKLFVIGRRGLLDRLRVNLDFPKNQIDLFLDRNSDPKFPALSEEFPSLETVIQSFELGNLASATMLLAWEMETFVERIIQENSNVRVHIPSGMSLDGKLKRIFKIKKLSPLDAEIHDLIDARNAAAHASSNQLSMLSKDKVLQAAERIASELSKISAEKKLGMMYQMYRDSRGEWRWRLKASNGRIIADSAESFKIKQKCLDDIIRVRGSASVSVIES